jgi:hypothetical protein
VCASIFSGKAHPSTFDRQERIHQEEENCFHNIESTLSRENFRRHRHHRHHHHHHFVSELIATIWGQNLLTQFKRQNLRQGDSIPALSFFIVVVVVVIIIIVLKK